VATLTAPPEQFSDIEDLYCGSVYPRVERGQGYETALCLFSAMWYGMQDVYWIAKAGLVGMCVDLDGEKLNAMREVYPEGWEFVEGDVFEFAEDTDRTWDVVTLDPWTGQFERCADLLPLWCSLAESRVVLGHGNYRLPDPVAPEGWQLVLKLKRSDYKGGIYWMVYERD
jgi:hypothetical protein